MWPFGCCPYLYKCGGIAPIKATDAMTQPVGQRNGQLFTEPTGGGGGSSDYDDLDNKPQIGGVTLTGNKTASDLSLETRGKITIGGTEYAVTRKALAITENGVTTTYYVADIT